MVLPKPWVAMLHCSPVTTVLLNKMGFPGTLSVSFTYPDTLICLDYWGFLSCPQCFPPYYGIFMCSSVSLSNSEILQRLRVCLRLRTSLKHRKYLIVTTSYSSSLKR